ncbi:flagellar hook-associated protein FlgL [Desulfoplanes formicivorans]|uniref:Flagellar hook-associated protein 3 n=1 Tax=Desulfoplanes formicivorans TaxID=1592317 RepID=A0A194AK56_9BACT|nr:flagellar hook-associated protein FlgL [Desulfoplanes formicivorans]GAU09625.1 flagellar hook-associated protein 3 [Desulfoplanes formicivorans]
MRVAHRSMYANFLTNMNMATSELVELNNKASSQKDVNKPSDDPLGTARILAYRDSLSALDQYLENIDTATGWLSLADETLVQASDLVTRAKEIAEQAATGTMTAANRDILSYDMRQVFDQMISLANTSFGGKSIFAGQEVSKDAYESGLMVYDRDGAVEPYVENISGTSDRSVKVQFLEDGTTGTDDIDYRYSRDGGKTWVNGVVSSADRKLDLGDGLSVTLRAGFPVTGSPADNEDVSVGTWLTVAPTAVYVGGNDQQAAVTLSSEDFQASTQGAFERDVTVQIVSGNLTTPVDVTYRYSYDGGGTWIPGPPDTFTAKETGADSCTLELPGGEITVNGSGDATGLELTVQADTASVLQMGSNVNAYAEGGFDRSMMVRIDNDPGMFGTGDTIEYSYSLDGGRSWVTGRQADNTAEPELFVPGGTLKLSAKGGNDDLAQGDQFVIQPQLAELAVDIAADNRVTINNVGSDIFGGSLAHGTGHYGSMDEDGSNLFVTMGKLIAALENNDQAGIAQSLDDLKVAQSQLLNQAADVGSRENRLSATKTILSGLKLNQEERMSTIEDVDIAELMTDLNKQEIIYQAVLTSSSRIMKMSLLDYI